ncbi:MAG: 5'-nucleotidase C-terminal domain-containing protein [Lachnospiraceae bacterium]|nr:5'-nucleotidase C-terminal domain-containing protein [Lachnospiraceae bacterium]
MLWKKALSKWKICMGMGVCSVLFAAAPVSASDTTTIRVISTADLHSQVSSQDYESAGKSTAGSLAQLSTMIRSAKEEITDGTCITVDTGDSIYGYAAEYIKAKNGAAVQPIYEGMSKIGYDAIVLGNHDFDFGYDYIYQQLKSSGLSNICLVSNVVRNSDGRAPWASTKMINRTVTTEQGKQVQVKIGIVGATRPSLSNMYDYDGTLVTSGIISSVKNNAAALKKAGADVVIAIVHAGMGDNTSTDSDKDVAYALSKLENVDCIMAGHAHRNFPSEDGNVQIYYDLPGVNRSTGLVNGKPVLISADHGKAIGICDLSLSINGNKVRVAGAKPMIRRTSQAVTPDPVIESISNKYDAEIQKQYQSVLASLRTGDRVTGYFSLLEDNTMLQLNNEAKIRFGMQYQSTREGKAYAGYPVISASRVYMDGSEGKDDYFDVSDNITWGDLMRVQRYEHNWNYIYWITGAQLKEWLEWSASIYAQSGEQFTSDSILYRLSLAENKTSLISNGWNGSYGQYVQFDGIHYEIDVTEPAKYDAAGHVIYAQANRIKNLTCQGRNVTNQSKFLMVCNEISTYNLVLSDLTKQRLVKDSTRNTVDYLKDYIQEMNQYAPIADEPDHNWKLLAGDEQRILRTSSLSELLAQARSWYQKTLGMTDQYGYYSADLSQEDKDQYGPLLVLAPSTTESTNESVTISVRTEDSSGVASCLYLAGNVEEDDPKWEQGMAVISNRAIVRNNGEYTFQAKDKQGNVTTRHININNIDANVLPAPEVMIPVNKKTVVTGYARAGLTVYITVAGTTYATTAKSNSTFSYDVGKHRAGTAVYVYVQDGQGRKSKTVKVLFDRTGPNPPTLDPVSNKTTRLTGKIGESCVTMVAYVGSKYAYVSRGGTAAYRASHKYDPNRQIIEVNTTLSNDRYSIPISAVNAGVSVRVFAIDLKHRVSIVAVRTVKKAAPNMPTINVVCDAENAITGKIPLTKKACNVTVKVSGKKYTAKSAKNGKFEVKTPKLKSGMLVSVYASDKSNGKTRKSASASCKVASKKNYVAKAKKIISVKKITSRTVQLTGKAKKGTELYLNYGSSYSKLDLDKKGRFSYDLPRAIKSSEPVYFVDRHKNGSIIAVRQIKVKAAKPGKPQLSSAITTKSKEMKILSKEDATLVAKIGKKTYKVKKDYYSSGKQAYVYTVKLPKAAVAQKIVCYMKNNKGNGAKITVLRRKA